LLPRKGSGSKGGKLKDAVELANGVSIKVITRGGQDTAKAGITARHIRITEAAGWSHSTTTSQEADVFRQLKARQRAFPRDVRQTIIEGTVTTEDELPWRLQGNNEQLTSTMSRLLTPCPHCGAWISPEREDFRGWQDAKSELEAEELGSFYCPECSHVLTESDRHEANRDVKIVHFGQEIDRQGNVRGGVPATTTLWFRWSQWHNLLVPSSDHAVDEWKARQCEEGTEDRDSAEKELCQFVWSVPYEPNYDVDDIKLDTNRMRKRTEQWPASIIPGDTSKIGVGIDIGKYRCWYVALAGREDYGIHCPAYAPVTVMTKKEEDDDEVDIAILAALRDLRDNVLEPGWMMEEGGEVRVPNEVWLDAGWHPGVVAAFVRESNKLVDCDRYVACRGRGRSARLGGVYTSPKRRTQTIRKIGDGYPYHLERNYERRITEATFDADFSKLWFQQRWVTKPGTPGALSLYYSPDRNEHGQFSTHVANEQYLPVEKPRKGVVKEWTKKGQNHLLDAGGMACMALINAGFDIRNLAGVESRDSETEEHTSRWGNSEHTSRWGNSEHTSRWGNSV
jgi:phage terminase large subunit GpA-like protein